MPLVESGKPAISRQVCFVSREVVEVGGVVVSFAVGVVRHQRIVLAEALLELQNAALEQSRGVGLVVGTLSNQRIYKTRIVHNKGALGSELRIPGLERTAIGSWDSGNDRSRRQQVGIDTPRQTQGVNVNVAGRDRHIVAKLALDAQGALLRVWIVEVSGNVVDHREAVEVSEV